MNIKNVTIKNFTVFEEIEVNFSKGINIIIGENGSGKTHLLKLIYGIGETMDHKNPCHISKDYFKTTSSNLIKKDDLNSDVIIKYSDNKEVSYVFPKLDDGIESMGYIGNEVIPKSIFIPAKEMLSHSKGFLALNNKYELPFDKTYIDIITNAELPESKNISEISNKVLEIISKIIDGKVVYENDSFYIVKKDQRKIEFSLEAEGLRKFGLLYKLIRNGLIEKNTILLWDEPESNINPELIPVLVDIMIMLEREGVQIIIATHSYNLAKYFEVKRKENDSVLFHSLYKTEKGVKVQSNEYFGELDNNSIIKADSKLLDEVIEESLED